MGYRDFAYGDGEVFEAGVVGGDDTLFISGSHIYGDAAELGDGALGGKDLFVVSEESRGSIMDFEKGKDLLGNSAGFDFAFLDDNASGTRGDGDKLAAIENGDTVFAFSGFGSGGPTVTMGGAVTPSSPGH
jgi:CheY-like chemotaxis protein